MSEKQINITQHFHKEVQNAAANIEGDFNVNNQSGNLAEAAAEIKQLLDQLATDYSDLDPDEKLTTAKIKLREATKADPTLKDRLLGAIESGGSEAIKTLLSNNPFVSIPLETLRGWLKP